jgi:hypothetical protein
LFDKIVLQQQGILLGVYDDIFDVPDVFYQTTSLQALLLLLEIARHTALQTLSLTYIDNSTRIIEILVAARRVG